MSRSQCSALMSRCTTRTLTRFEVGSRQSVEYCRIDWDSYNAPLNPASVLLLLELDSLETDVRDYGQSRRSKTHGTNPLEADSDGDGVPDGVEIASGTDPLTIPSAPMYSRLVFVALLITCIFAKRLREP